MQFFTILATKKPVFAIRGSLLTAVAIILATPASTHAASTEAVTQSFAFQPTDWNTSVDLPLFDGSLGTLTGVVFELEGTVGGTIAYENQDTSPQTITLQLSSELNVEAPAGLVGVSDLVTTNTTIEIIENPTAFDGTVDFAGTSGNTYNDLIDSNATTATYDDSNPLWEFSIRDYFTTDTPGTTVPLPVTATAQSSASGSGNLALILQTNAGGLLTATYFYEPIPEPVSLALLASGLFLLGGRRRS